MPALTPPIKCHGGKHYLASKIVAMMPPHTHYVEPYFGGGAVLLAKDPEGVSEVVNDINGHLMNLWNVLACPPEYEKLKRALEMTPFSEVTWNDTSLYVSTDAGVSSFQAWAYFVHCRQSLAGRMGTFAPLSRNRTRRGMNEQASAWLTAIEGLPAVHARLKRVVIFNRDALDVIKQQDGDKTLFYCDPPYLHETRSSTGEYAKYEMADDQHLKLLETLASIKGKFLLSGYSSDMYKSFAKKHKWKCRTFNLPNNAAAGKSKQRKTECVWTNY